MIRHKRKGRPIAAGDPRNPKRTHTAPHVSNPIVSEQHPLVKWLEGLRPGVMFTAGEGLFTVSAVEPIRHGRVITLAMANGIVANPPAKTRGGIRHG